MNFIAFANLDFFPQSNLLLDMGNPVSTERNHVWKKWKYSTAQNNMIFGYQMLNQRFVICTRNPWRIPQTTDRSLISADQASAINPSAIWCEGPGWVAAGAGGGRRETEGYEEVRGMVWGKGGRIRQGWKVWYVTHDTGEMWDMFLSHTQIYVKSQNHPWWVTVEVQGQGKVISSLTFIPVSELFCQLLSLLTYFFQLLHYTLI